MIDGTGSSTHSGTSRMSVMRPEVRSSRTPTGSRRRTLRHPESCGGGCIVETRGRQVPGSRRLRVRGAATVERLERYREAHRDLGLYALLLLQMGAARRASTRPTRTRSSGPRRGAGEIQEAEPDSHLHLNARILAYSAATGADTLITVCNVCTLNLRQANHQLPKDAALCERVNDNLERVGVPRYEQDVDCSDRKQDARRVFRSDPVRPSPRGPDLPPAAGSGSRSPNPARDSSWACTRHQLA
jgi:hypothetical protein